MRSKWYYSSLEDNTLPSQVPDYDWISCQYESTSGGLDTTVGKWMLFCKTSEENNELWTKLKSLLYQDKLGISMKSATTFSETAISYKGTQRGILICVYTKNWRDLDDIRLVLSSIRELGIKGPLYYKSDRQTLLGMSGSIYLSKYGTHIEITPSGQRWLEYVG